MLKAFFKSFDVTSHVNAKLLTGLAAIGALHLITQYLSTPLVGFYRHVLRPQRNLVKRYGSEWAVVTGASDGIGEAYTYELAKRGFNIILVSRTLEKLERVAAKVRDEYKVQTKIIQFDFGTLYTAESVNELYVKLDTIDVDVSLLANNAGVASQG
jgi:17beta-estradiol 17-dehydrogenase / very-long-chain 3-oxoacyl-CoA reductase